MSNPIQSVLDEAVAAGAAPGLAAAARLPSGEVVLAAAGVRGLDNAEPMTPDTVFWIASFTKALTTAAALQLVEQARIGLEDPVGAWLPALAKPKVLEGFDADGKPRLADAAHPITLRHLLTHTSGLAYDFCHAGLAAYVAAAGANATGAGGDIVLMFEPGSDWTYGTGLDWAGQLVEAVSGEPFDDYLAAHVMKPLGMTASSFAPEAGPLRASMHARLPDGSLAAIPFGMPPGRYPAMGGGGLYSTAPDYLRFLEAILAGGAPILKPGTVAAMSAIEWEAAHVGVLPGVNPQLCGHFDPSPGAVKQWGLGFVINPAPGPNGRSAGSLAWAGLGNCYYWADPAAGAAGVLLSQVLPFGDARVLDAFAAFERAVYGR
jgi:CubicO group peptidase (beta-lactamase class C family)